MLLFYTGASRESAEIIAEQSNNVETGNRDAIEAMHKIKQEAVRMKEALPERRLRPSLRCLAGAVGTSRSEWRAAS